MSVFLLCLSAVERDDWDFLMFCQILNFLWNLVILGSYLWKLSNRSFILPQRVPFFDIFFWVKKVLNIFLTKQTSRSGFIGNLNVFWTFSPLSQQQGLKMKFICHCKNEDPPFVLQAMFWLQADTFDGFSPKKLKSICLEYILKD